jgi:2-dehydro-3-deoxyphosphogluconate aldolase/(4S)-4-hydroxy-2-oxoglutarate aldolase
MENLQFVLENKIVAIIRGLGSDKTIKLAEALFDGGIRLIEVTFDQKDPSSWTTTGEAIKDLAREFGRNLLPGAGTVMSVEQLCIACDAGAKYIISPNCDREVILATKRAGLLSFPGAFTPSEIATASNWGADVVKVFPANLLGPSYIKAIRAPISHIPLMAVGGVNERNAAEFIKAGCVGVGVGGNLVDKKLITSGDWDGITAKAKEYVKEVENA